MSDLLVTQKLSSIPGATIDTTTQFADLTTLHLGGQPRAVVRCASTQAVIDVVSLLDAHQVSLLIIGGGSNLVIADGPVDVVAVVLECDNIHIDPDSGILRTEAGAVWTGYLRLYDSGSWRGHWGFRVLGLLGLLGRGDRWGRCARRY